jgi:hypothetical protein
MGATTTQGTGPGSVPIKKNGTEPANLGINRLVGPKIIAAGLLTLKDSSDFVKISAPIGNPSDYCILLTGTSKTNPYISRSLSAIASDIWQFEVTAGHHDLVHYVVIKIGVS